MGDGRGDDRGAPAGLEVRADRSEIGADGRDLSFVTVRVVDADGVLAPRADNRIRFRVEGPAEIVATDNGDPTSFEPFPSPERRAFGGLCLAIVRARAGESGHHDRRRRGGGPPGTEAAPPARYFRS